MLTCGYGFLRTGRTHGTDLRIRNARMTTKGNRATLSLHRAHGEAPVATGPGDQVAAAGRGRLRASHADREQVIDTLKAAFVQGRLAKDEFDARVGSYPVYRSAATIAPIPWRHTQRHIRPTGWSSRRERRSSHLGLFRQARPPGRARCRAR